MKSVKSYCLIRFGNEIDSHISYILGILSCEPIKQCQVTNGTVITPFKSQISIDKCRNILEKYGYGFILVDVTENTDKVQVFGLNKFLNIPERQPKEILTGDLKERYLLLKQAIGDQLSFEEHEFMKNRMKA